MLSAQAQERGTWRPVNKTAQQTTGEITIAAEKMTINFFTFPIAEIRPLTQAEIAAAFSDSEAGVGGGHLYRLNIPGDKRFLHKNTLCGAEDTQWMATYYAGKTLRLALFSDAKPPALTVEGMNDSSTLCGAYAYAR
ncbi:hypothetical protein SAMN05421770_101589 [Granulicella rosea]|uniref:Uncharacterized protein n=1 Tax=Granulicella rosea TaxID=474952 RepID=A0A239DPL0_9BACT|nr:hypothetical protein [Granulicella rosea]SNS34440.1 hypothetical protein SAMN05421770_101589 [Granulicella rosea]